jgi:hypothetical protein
MTLPLKTYTSGIDAVLGQDLDRNQGKCKEHGRRGKKAKVVFVDDAIEELILCVFERNVSHPALVSKVRARGSRKARRGLVRGEKSVVNTHSNLDPFLIQVVDRISKGNFVKTQTEKWIFRR